MALAFTSSASHSLGILVVGNLQVILLLKLACMPFCVPDADPVQERASDFLELEFQVVVNPHVGVGQSWKGPSQEQSGTKGSAALEVSTGGRF